MKNQALELAVAGFLDQKYVSKSSSKTSDLGKLKKYIGRCSQEDTAELEIYLSEQLEAEELQPIRQLLGLE